jgi:hypothetical protein
MRNFFDFYKEQWADSKKPWLMLGKGPSFARRSQFDLTNFNLISLNHAVRELKVTVAHAADMEVLESCSDAIEANASYLVMPWIPGVAMRAGEIDLAAWLAFNPTLQKMDRENRLLWYNLSTSRWMNGSSPVVNIKYFNSEAVVNLLGHSGVKTLKMLGIDGGVNYSSEFEDLAGTDRLANGQPSFDLQFEEFEKSAAVFKMDLCSLTSSSSLST